MKSNSWKTWFCLTLAAILLAMLAWYIFSEAQFPLLTFIAIMILVVGVSAHVWRIIRNFKNRALGVPPEMNLPDWQKSMREIGRSKYQCFCGF